MTRPLIFICLLFCFLSCKKGESFDCFKTNGKDVTEQRTVGSFSTIKVFDKLDMTLVQGSEYKVEVTAGEHVIHHITTTVTNGELDIHNNNTCNFVRGYKRKIKVTVTVPYVWRVENWGVGSISVDAAFAQDSILVHTESSGDIHLRGTYGNVSTSSNGNGDIYLEGSGSKLYVSMYGTNFLYADNFLVSNFIFVETSSMGDCFVNGSAAHRLQSRIFKNGNIYYTGNPPDISNDYENDCKGRLIAKN